MILILSNGFILSLAGRNIYKFQGMSNIKIEDKIQLLHTKARWLIENKKADDEIIAELKKEGIDQNYATTVINNVRNDLRKKKEFWKQLLMGSFITIAGLLVNYLSYKFAEETGSGEFLLIWGVVVIGIITIIRAFILFRK